MKKLKSPDNSKTQSFEICAWLSELRFLSGLFDKSSGFYFGRKFNFADLYFRQICPSCAERMKYMRKVPIEILYTCYTCYKSWIRQNKTFTETKLTTK
jgi:hypothetical protein